MGLPRGKEKEKEGWRRSRRRPCHKLQISIPRGMGRVDFLATQSSWSKTCPWGPAHPAGDGANPQDSAFCSLPTRPWPWLFPFTPKLFAHSWSWISASKQVLCHISIARLFQCQTKMKQTSMGKLNWCVCVCKQNERRNLQHIIGSIGVWVEWQCVEGSKLINISLIIPCLLLSVQFNKDTHKISYFIL